MKYEAMKVYDGVRQKQPWIETFSKPTECSEDGRNSARPSKDLWHGSQPEFGPLSAQELLQSANALGSLHLPGPADKVSGNQSFDCLNVLAV